jgi:hypothetical protein
MALSAPVAITPLTRPSGIPGFYVDRRRPCSIIHVTKSNGDTSGTVDTLLTYVKEVIILLADGTIDTTATATTGYGLNGATFSTVLASLTAGTAFYVIAIGGRN